MFQHESKEQIENCIDVEDISYDVMKETIRFLYDAKSPKLGQLAGELLVTAEKVTFFV